MGNKFSVGDRVEIIRYGHLIHAGINLYDYLVEIVGSPREEGYVDIKKEVVGKRGVIDAVKNVQGVFKYSIAGIPEKSAWYNEDQLILDSDA